MQVASGVDFKDLYWSAHLPSIFDQTTDRVPNSFRRSSFPFSIQSPAECAPGRCAVVRRDGHSVSAIICGSLARRRVALAEI